MSAFGENIRREIRSSRTAWGFAIVCLSGLFVQGKWDTYWFNRTTRVCVINGDTALIGYADPAAQSNEAIREAAKVAAKAIFGRVPDRIEDEETLKRVVNTPTLKSIEKNWSESKPAYMARSITTEFRCDGDIKCLYVDSDHVDALITGHLSQDEIIERSAHTTLTKMRVTMHFIVNGDYLINHKWPLVVTGYEANPI